MATLDEFSKRIKNIGTKIEVNADKEIVKLCLAIQQTVILSTPVDTGRARGNWFATIGFPSNKINEDAIDKDGQSVISDNTVIIRKRKNGQSVYITNNLKYIKRLNQGHSKQAPANYVEKAVIVAQESIKNARLLVD